jgi:hypothetical protein
METLNTIAANWTTLSNSTVDWSPTAGPIWLLGTTIIMALYFAAWAILENRREKAAARQLAYAEAQKMAARRLERKEALGYMEYRNF